MPENARGIEKCSRNNSESDEFAAFGAAAPKARYRRRMVSP